MAKAVKVQKPEKAEYRPDVTYQWDEQDEVTISGMQFNVILRSLQAASNTPEFARNAAIFQGLTVLNDVLKSMVEKGVAKEKPQSGGNGKA